jgi:N-acetylglutamate synthase-like GNAT family acetyltransferase
LITATSRPATWPARAPLPAAFPVRPARRRDATALAALSWPFVRSGALRERPLSLYASDATDFLVVDARDGTLDGCLGLRVHPAVPVSGRAPMGVLYNFCVAPGSQSALFTATTGSGGLFLRYGFAPACASLAPASWANSLDPRRNSRVLARVL